MIERLKYIELSGENYPIKCDLAVLEEAQERYGTINEFEIKLAGFEVDENGKIVRNEKNKIVRKEPSFKAVRFALHRMVNEGIDIENQYTKEKKNHLSEKEISFLCTDVNVFDLADQLHDEFCRCFQSKNRKSTQEEKETLS